MNAATTTTTTAPAVAPAVRYEPFTPIHKAVRRTLFETAMLLGRTDFASPAETASAERAVAACFGLLREHAEHEDRHVVPVVAGFDPALGQALTIDHPRLERSAIAVDSLWPRLVHADGPSRVKLGGELRRRFHSFVAMQLEHMNREENEVTEVLWANLSDADLMAISGRIVASIPPARMAEWVDLMLPVLSRPEREAMAPKAA